MRSPGCVPFVSPSVGRASAPKNDSPCSLNYLRLTWIAPEGYSE
jgi:hypothetical protein